MIDEQEFKDWAQHPCTKALRAACAGRRADLRNEWEQNDPTAYVDQQFALGNAANIGTCRGLSFAETFDYEQYLTEMEPADGKSQRPRTPRRGSTSQDV